MCVIGFNKFVSRGTKQFPAQFRLRKMVHCFANLRKPRNYGPTIGNAPIIKDGVSN